MKEKQKLDNLIIEVTKKTEQQAQNFINNLHLQYETEKFKQLELLKKNKKKHVKF